MLCVECLFVLFCFELLYLLVVVLLLLLLLLLLLFLRRLFVFDFVVGCLFVVLFVCDYVVCFVCLLFVCVWLCVCFVVVFRLLDCINAYTYNYG